MEVLNDNTKEHLPKLVGVQTGDQIGYKVKEKVKNDRYVDEIGTGDMAGYILTTTVGVRQEPIKEWMHISQVIRVNGKFH